MDCKNVYERIKAVLEKYKADFELLDYYTLQAYIDLLFNFASGYETITKNCLQIASK